MKNILWITPGFAADENDSRCIPPLQLLARQLEQSNSVSLTIIALHYPFKKKPYIWHGIQIYPCFQSGPFQRFKIWRKAIQYIWKICKEKDISVIHSFWLSDAAMLSQWTKLWHKKPHWVTFMGQDVRGGNRYLHLMPVCKMSTIAVSPFQDQVLDKNKGCKSNQIIPWGIDPSEFRFEHSEKVIDVLGVGNLTTLKDYQTFIQLLSNAKSIKPDLTAVLIGDGLERKKLEDLANALDLGDNLKFTGYLSRDEVLKYMARSKVLLHTSTYESFGYVFLEALASGMLIVSRPVGIAKESNYWYVGNDIEELGRALLLAIENYKTSDPVFPYLISATLASYLQVYERA